jgi:reactive intermediate/imine deaminase
MKVIQTPDMPNANGHYSQCIEHNGTLYISGQLPIDPVTGEISQIIENQADLVFRKIEIILNEAGVTKNEVIQMRLYISDINLWEKVNERYSLFFGRHKPVRCVIPTGKLHYGCLIEVEAVAQATNLLN